MMVRESVPIKATKEPKAIAEGSINLISASTKSHRATIVIRKVALPRSDECVIYDVCTRCRILN